MSLKLAIPILSAVWIAGCSTGQDLPTPAAALVEPTQTSYVLAALPQPHRSIDVAVYEFPDLTGQAKPNDDFAEFSRAVTQGGAQILIDVLKGSGNWFRVVERTGLRNLVQERTLIENTQRSYGERVTLPPVRFAGLILEGGIISYDSNEVTGGAGARYLGIGGDVRYRSDSVTVNLRAVSVQTGEVMVSTTTTKQIYSFQARAGAYYFVVPDELLEIEIGQSRNDPGSLAVREGIELAVYSLIVEGVRTGLWSLADERQEGVFIQQYDEIYRGLPVSPSSFVAANTASAGG